MSIKDLSEKIKYWWYGLKSRLPQGESVARYYTAAVIILVGMSSFGLGRLSALDEQREPVMIEKNGEVVETAPPTAAVGGASAQSASVLSSSPPLGGGDVRGGVSNKNKPFLNPPLVKTVEEIAAGGKLVASRNGTKYYFPWCGSVARIAEANKIWFNSEAEAKQKGYSPAANCKGLK